MHLVISDTCFYPIPYFSTLFPMVGGWGISQSIQTISFQASIELHGSKLDDNIILCTYPTYLERTSLIFHYQILGKFWSAQSFFYFDCIFHWHASLTLNPKVLCSNLSHTISFSQEKLLVTMRFEFTTLESKVSYACPWTMETEFFKQKNFFCSSTWGEMWRPLPMGK